MVFNKNRHRVVADIGDLRNELKALGESKKAIIDEIEVLGKDYIDKEKGFTNKVIEKEDEIKRLETTTEGKVTAIYELSKELDEKVRLKKTLEDDSKLIAEKNKSEEERIEKEFKQLKEFMLSYDIKKEDQDKRELELNSIEVVQKRINDSQNASEAKLVEAENAIQVKEDIAGAIEKKYKDKILETEREKDFLEAEKNSYYKSKELFINEQKLISMERDTLKDTQIDLDEKGEELVKKEEEYNKELKFLKNEISGLDDRETELKVREARANKALKLAGYKEEGLLD